MSLQGAGDLPQRRSAATLLRRLVPWLLVLGAGVLALGADYALGKVSLVATYAIAGLGVVIVVGQAGQIALGQGALVALVGKQHGQVQLGAADWA